VANLLFVGEVPYWRNMQDVQIRKTTYILCTGPTAFHLPRNAIIDLSATSTYGENVLTLPLLNCLETCIITLAENIYRAPHSFCSNEYIANYV
jgi:hypothetical protein